MSVKIFVLGMKSFGNHLLHTSAAVQRAEESRQGKKSRCQMLLKNACKTCFLGFQG